MRLERCTWPQVESYFAEHDLVVMVFGSIEQHGRHNPLGTDLFAPSKIVELVERQLPGVLVAPALPYGSTPRFAEFPGTMSLGDELLYQVVLKLCESLNAYGARHFVFVNGHGGNSKCLTDVGLTMARRGCRCAQLDWWSMVGDFNPEWAGGHGGGQETSANLYIDPETVDLSALEDMQFVNDAGDEMPTVHFDRVTFKGVTVQMPRPTCDYAKNGWIGPDDPRKASAAWGEEMLNAVANWTAEFIPAFEKTPLPVRDLTAGPAR